MCSELGPFTCLIYQFTSHQLPLNGTNGFQRSFFDAFLASQTAQILNMALALSFSFCLSFFLETTDNKKYLCQVLRGH